MLGYLFTPSNHVNFMVVTIINLVLAASSLGLWMLEQSYPKDVAGFWIIVSLLAPK